METYGVSFEGFQPACGWSMYKNAEEHMIPNLKCEVEHYQKLRDKAGAELAALKGLETDIKGLCKSREGLVAKLQASVADSKDTVSDLISKHLHDAQGKSVVMLWDGLSDWLEEARPPIEQLAFLYEIACERAKANFRFYEEYAQEYENAIRFWSQTLELERAHWVFENAALKYKTKICREIVKALGGYVCDCRAQLVWIETGRDADVLKHTPMREDVEWLLREAEADLAYYRQIKADIAAAGVEEAIKHSSRKITFPAVNTANERDRWSVSSSARLQRINPIGVSLCS